MSTYLPKDLQAGLDAARLARPRKKSRIRVKSGGASMQILRLWKSGFSVDASAGPALRGSVDVFDGATHLYKRLIVASEEEAGEMRYEFKRSTPVRDRAALDFVQDVSAPVGLIEKG